MLVIVSNIYLTYPPYWTVSVNFCQYTYLESPIAGYFVYPCNVNIHGKFSCKRISKAVKEFKERKVAMNFFQRPYEWCYKEPCNPSMHPVRNSAVISFAKFIFEYGIGGGITESCKHFSVIGKDVTIMKSNNTDIFLCDNITICYPCRLPFTCITELKTCWFYSFVYFFDSVPIVPNKLGSLW